jgi:hypothetical protein
MDVGGPPPIPRPIAGPQPSIAQWLGPALALAMGAGFSVFAVANGGRAEPIAGPLAIGLIWASPGIIGLLGAARRPSLLLGAGMLGIALAFTPLSVTIVLGIPAGMCLVGYGRRAPQARGRTADPVVGLLCLVGGLASFFSLFVHGDPRTVTTATSSEYSSDVVTAAEAAIALTILAATIALAWFLSKPVADE